MQDQAKAWIAHHPYTAQVVVYKKPLALQYLRNTPWRIYSRSDETNMNNVMYLDQPEGAKLSSTRRQAQFQSQTPIGANPFARVYGPGVFRFSISTRTWPPWQSHLYALALAAKLPRAELSSGTP